MRRNEFEKQVLELWMESRVPLTLVNVQYYTGASRKETEKHLDDMAREDVAELIVGNDGEVRWKVKGARRPLEGAVTFEELERRRGKKGKGSSDILEDFERMRAGASTAMQVKDVADDLRAPRKDGDRSYLLSGVLSLFFGPLGWLYAGGWREAIPASAGYLFLVWLLPSFMLYPLLGVVAPISAIAGLIYVYKYNKHGKRRTILNYDKQKALPK